MNPSLTSYLLCIGFKKMFRKSLKILNKQDPNFSVYFIGAMVCVPLPTVVCVCGVCVCGGGGWVCVCVCVLFFIFSTLVHKVNEA